MPEGKILVTEQSKTQNTQLRPLFVLHRCSEKADLVNGLVRASLGIFKLLLRQTNNQSFFFIYLKGTKRQWERVNVVKTNKTLTTVKLYN